LDLYVVLGLAHGASEAEIKRAYRRLARRFHPDINPGDQTAEVRFRQILAAYETLIDPTRRSRYDSGQAADDGGGPKSSGFEGFDFSSRGLDHSASFGDLFAEVLTSRGSRPSPQERGADLHLELQLAFEEALAGGLRSVPVTRRESCRVCAGTGLTRTSPGRCHVCQGAGAVRSVRGHMVFSRSCAACGGTGQQRPRPCEPCAGSGNETRAEMVQVRIPAGVADGDRVRVAGKGNAGPLGGPLGDLYITVHVESHPQFRREGDDIHTVLPLAIHEAALGTRLDIATPDGTARLRVPPGTQAGQRFRLRERGAASPRNGRRGDLVVEVRLMLPKVLDERSKELLREFGRINGGTRDAGDPGQGDRGQGAGSRRQGTGDRAEDRG
jgi:molecular chaperone DnaJ